MGTELSSRVLADTDVLLAVGNSFNAISTARWSLKLPAQIVQIDIDPTILGRYYADRTLGILGDARAVLSALAGELAEAAADGEAGAARRKRLAGLAEARQSWWRKASETGGDTHAGVIAPDAVMAVVRKVTPKDAIAVFDAGNPGVWSYLWEITSPGTYLEAGRLRQYGLCGAGGDRRQARAPR